MTEKRSNFLTILTQLVRFGASGAATVGSDYLTFSALFAMGAPLFVATLGSLLVGFVVSFTLNRQWVFNAKSDNAQRKARQQLALYTVLFVFNTMVAYWFIGSMQHAGMSVYVAKPISMLFITAWNFVIYKKVIFRLKATAPEGARQEA